MWWTSILVTDLGGLACGAWLLFGGQQRARSWTDDLGRLILLGVTLLGGAVLAGKVGGGGFLTLRLACHALFCVLAPLAIARGLQRRGGIGWTVVALGLAAEGAYVWARHVEPYRLEVTRHELVSARLDGRSTPLRVGVLSDLQTDDFGAFEERVFAELDGLEADLVLIPGDIMQLRHGDAWERHRGEREKLRALFARVRRPRLGYLMVPGDCEPTGSTFDNCGVRMLADERVEFPAERLQVIGLSREASRRPIEARWLEAARAFPGLSIVVGHAPEFALSAPTAGVPLLCLAGHTHGGQVQLPFFGPPLTLSRVPRSIAAGGLHRLDESWVCVSRGIGMERNLAPRIRFLCRPELILFELAPLSGVTGSQLGSHATRMRCTPTKSSCLAGRPSTSRHRAIASLTRSMSSSRERAWV